MTDFRKEKNVNMRDTWEQEEPARKILKEVIGSLKARQVENWSVYSNHEKTIFTAIGKYRYAKTTIVSPLRIKIVLNREEKMAGFVVFHVDEPSEPKFYFEQKEKKSGKSSLNEKMPDFHWYFPELTDRKTKSNPQQFQRAFGREDIPEGEGMAASKEDFITQAVSSWESIKAYIEECRPGKENTLSALRNGAYTTFRGFFKKQGGFVFTSLDGRVVEDEADGDRIAWLLQMDHRFYRDLSKLATAPIPFCPFVQFIGPGMGKWSTGWETTREFRALPRSVKHYFWHMLFGKDAEIEPNGDSVFFNRSNRFSQKALMDAMTKLENEHRGKIAGLWEKISDPESFQQEEVSPEKIAEEAEEQQPAEDTPPEHTVGAEEEQPPAEDPPSREHEETPETEKMDVSGTQDS